MSVVEEFQAAAATAIERAGPAVVRIGRGPGRGAGVVVADGVVVTNAHNLRGSETTVTFADGRAVTGTVAGVDRDGDLAAISVATAGVTPIPWDGATEPVVGTPVLTLVNLTGFGVRVTTGIVSGAGRAFRGPTGRLIGDSVEHTAPLGRGSSGGPVVDLQGRLVAINTHRLGDGFYLAVPATGELRERVAALARGESPQRVHLGVALAPVRAARRMRAAVGLPERDGLLVRGVEEDSPAARAGILVGDLIVEAGGQPIASTDQLFGVLDGLDVDASLGLRLLRGTDEITLNVNFAGTSAEGSA